MITPMLQMKKNMPMTTHGPWFQTATLFQNQLFFFFFFFFGFIRSDIDDQRPEAVSPSALVLCQRLKWSLFAS